jgi:nucleoside-diphosphate-sugar epimerase
MPKILLTGANSFVGRNYLAFSENGDIDEISLIDNKPEDINYENYGVVIHLVAIVHQSKKIKGSEYFRVNRDLCIQVAECAKKAGVSHFIFLSTVKVYGKFKPGSDPWNELSECFPEDFYGKSKYEAENHLRELSDPGFIVSIIRTPLVYGEGVQANMYSILRLVDIFPILPFRGINNKRNFTSVENLTAFIDRIIILRVPGIFIAMDSKALSTTELVNLISKFLERESILVKIPRIFIKIGMKTMPKIFERLYGSFEMDNTATLKALDFQPPYTTEQCIMSMVKTYINRKK